MTAARGRFSGWSDSAEVILKTDMPNIAGIDREESPYNSGLLGSSTLSTESTAMGDSRDEYCDTTLLLRDL